MRESSDIAIAGVPAAWRTEIMAELDTIATNTTPAEPEALIMLPESDIAKDTGWTFSDSGTTAWNLISAGVDTPDYTKYVGVSEYSAISMTLGLSSVVKASATQVKVRVCFEVSYVQRTFAVGLYLANDTSIISETAVTLTATGTPEVKEFTATGTWSQADLDGMYLIITAEANGNGDSGKIYEAEVQVV